MSWEIFDMEIVNHELVAQHRLVDGVPSYLTFSTFQIQPRGSMPTY
jgi:hypothetical protein